MNIRFSVFGIDCEFSINTEHAVFTVRSQEGLEAHIIVDIKQPEPAPEPAPEPVMGVADIPTNDYLLIVANEHGYVLKTDLHGANVDYLRDNDYLKIANPGAGQTRYVLTPKGRARADMVRRANPALFDSRCS